MGNEVRVSVSVADPSALGMFGLAMATLISSCFKFGILSGLSLGIPWIIFLGAIAQLIACFNDFKQGNVFGATAFGGFGLFWFGIGLSWLIELGFFGEAISANIDKRVYGIVSLGYMAFSIVMMIASLEINKILFAMLALINVLLVCFVFASFGVMVSEMMTVAAISEFTISILGFYAFAASLLNKHFDRPLLSMGKPFGILK